MTEFTPFYNSCGRKKPHNTRHDAELWIAEDIKQGFYQPDEKQAYHCAYCSKWHIGRAAKPGKYAKALTPLPGDILFAYKRRERAENVLENIKLDRYMSQKDETINRLIRSARSELERLDYDFELLIKRYVDSRVVAAIENMHEVKQCRPETANICTQIGPSTNISMWQGHIIPPIIR